MDVANYSWDRHDFAAALITLVQRFRYPIFVGLCHSSDPSTVSTSHNVGISVESMKRPQLFQSWHLEGTTAQAKLTRWRLA